MDQKLHEKLPLLVILNTIRYNMLHFYTNFQLNVSQHDQPKCKISSIDLLINVLLGTLLFLLQ